MAMKDERMILEKDGDTFEDPDTIMGTNGCFGWS